ncbi:hypothetical protein ACW7EJ_10085, partial [Acinetobacter soli]
DAQLTGDEIPYFIVPSNTEAFFESGECTRRPFDFSGTDRFELFPDCEAQARSVPEKSNGRRVHSPDSKKASVLLGTMKYGISSPVS